MIQLQVLNKILQDKDLSIIYDNNITVEFFSDYVDEFKFIEQHYKQYNSTPDYSTFVAKFTNFDVIEVTEPTSYLIDALYNDYNRRHLAKTFNQIRQLLTADKTEEALALYMNSSTNLHQNKHLKCVDILKDFSRYDTYIEKCNNVDKYYIKTGFNELDRLTGGWDINEELATIIGRPGRGKSWILLKCATAAALQGLNVGIYSGEMTETKVGYRIDTLIGNISNGQILHGNVQADLAYRQYIESLKNITGSIKILTPAMIGGLAGINTLRSFIEREHLDILFVDQHSLLEDDHKAKNPVEKAANISRDLKQLQVLKKIPIISVSQQNRTSAENGVGTEHVAQSDRIAQDSTIIIGVEREDDILSLHLIKSRDGESGKYLRYHTNLDKGIFTYIPEDVDVTNSVDMQEFKEAFDGDDLL